MLKKINTINIFVILSAILFTMITLVACGDKGEKYYLPNVTVGGEFAITLDAHSGTAYQWSYETDSSGIEYVSMEFVPQNNEPNWVGGGQLVYTFKAINVGNYKIKFELSIPWESEPSIELKTYNIKVVEE